MRSCHNCCTQPHLPTHPPTPSPRAYPPLVPYPAPCNYLSPVTFQPSVKETSQAQVHPSRMALIEAAQKEKQKAAKPDKQSRPRGKVQLTPSTTTTTNAHNTTIISSSATSNIQEDEEESSDEDFEGVQVTVHRRPARRKAGRTLFLPFLSTCLSIV